MAKLRELIEELKKEIPKESKLDLDDFDSRFDAAYEEETQSGTEGLLKKNKELLAETKKLKAQLKAGDQGDVSPQLLELEEKLENQKLEYETKIKQLSQAGEGTRSKLEKELTKYKDLYTQTEGSFHSMLIDNELTKTLLEGKVKKEDFQLVHNFLRSGAQVVSEIVEGKQVPKVMVGGKALADHVTEYLASDAGKLRVSAPGGSGGGAGGGAGGAGSGGTKTIKRSEWENKNPEEKQALYKDKVQVVDD